MATAFGAVGVDVSPEALSEQVYIPDRKGSLQTELISATRRAGLVPVPVPRNVDAIVTQLRDGWPVLVLQNLGVRWIPIWHYAVVVGYAPEGPALWLRSGKKQRRGEKLTRFDPSWARSGHWGLVIADPAKPPPHVEPRDWIGAASAFESLGKPGLARTAYEAATKTWPNTALAWQALANVAYAEGDFGAAQSALTTAVELEPTAGGFNNLAQVAVDRGCRSEAIALLDRAGPLADATLTPVAAALAGTRRQAEALSADADDCAIVQH